MYFFRPGLSTLLFSIIIIIFGVIIIRVAQEGRHLLKKKLKDIENLAYIKGFRIFSDC